MGLKVLSPDINTSEIKYTGKNREIRIGLMQLKDLPQDIMEDIIHERTKNGPFLSFQDFLNLTSPRIHLQDVRILIKAGCFDIIAYGIPRSGLMWQALEFFNRKEEKRNPTLFDKAQTSDARNRCVSHQKPYPKNLMLKHESETLGFILSIHPLDVYRHSLKNLHYVRAKELHTQVGKHVTTIGWRITGKTVRTKEGDSMKFVSFEDPTGIYETVFFPKPYTKYCHMLNATRPYILKGKVEESFGAITPPAAPTAARPAIRTTFSATACSTATTTRHTAMNQRARFSEPTPSASRKTVVAVRIPLHHPGTS